MKDDYINADPMTVQAGVWAISDNYSGVETIQHLVLQDQSGNRRQAVTPGHIAQAWQILKALGIPNRLADTKA